jgi:hypothetical protein
MRQRALLVLIALAIAGCGSDAETTTTSHRGPTASAVCARIPTAAVERLIARAGGRRPPALRRFARGTSSLIECGLIGPGVKVVLSLDLAQDARQRFDNRVVEMTQFSTERPATRPRPVPGVGDPGAGDEGAQWIPALHQLLAYRPGRYLIVDFVAGGAGSAASRAGAADLARLTFPRMPRSPLPDLSEIPRSVGG